jgi:hypothetical protein
MRDRYLAGCDAKAYPLVISDERRGCSNRSRQKIKNSRVPGSNYDTGRLRTSGNPRVAGLHPARRASNGNGQVSTAVGTVGVKNFYTM